MICLPEGPPVPTATLMTTDDLLAMPDNDGIDRWLIAGELRERPMTTRNRFHSRAMTRVARFLDIWADAQPEPRGEVLTGDAGVRLAADPDTAFGVDVVYVAAEVMARQTADSTIVVGVPVLAVEILSPSSPQEDADDKIEAYLTAGVGAVWELYPRRRTVTVHRPGHNPTTFGPAGDLTGDPVLPGFRVPVAALFG